MAEEILREHVRKNLFVHSFYDEKKGWLFQYHHLFRDFLRAKFMTSAGHEEQKPLLLKAGTLYDQRGELENSVKYFLEANAYPQAASVIARFGVVLLRKGRIEDLSKWLHALPNGTIQDSPWLFFYLAMTKRFQGERESDRPSEGLYSVQTTRRYERYAHFSCTTHRELHSNRHPSDARRNFDRGGRGSPSTVGVD